MPGFFISNYGMYPTLKEYRHLNDFQFMEYENWKVGWNLIPKYQNDRVFFQDDDYIVILEGVILNKTILLNSDTDWTRKVISLIKESDTWFEQLKGMFSGAVYYKNEHKWIVFADQIATHMVYSYSNEGRVAFGSRPVYFSEWMKANDIARDMDLNWLYDIATYGCMRETYTMIKGLKRIYPGCYLECDSANNILEVSYFKFTKNNIIQASESEYIDMLDKSLKHCITEAIEKDREYGYMTVIDLSAGLDSRILAAYACKIAGADNLLAITYAQRGSADQVITEKVAKALGVNHIFYATDPGNILMDVDDLVLMNGGVNYFYGITGGKRLLDFINSDKLGMEIGGVLGDMYNGSIVKDTGTVLHWYSNCVISDTFNVRNVPKNPHSYEDNEMLWFYINNLFSSINPYMIRQNFIEPHYGYGDIAFSQLCLSIPLSVRTKGHIYRKWFIEKFPQLAKINYGDSGFPVSANNVYDILFKLKRGVRRVYSMIFHMKAKWSMNPLDFWLYNNKELQNFLRQYYFDNADVLNDFPESLNVVNKFLNDGKAIEILIAFSIISTVKTYLK